ncbi:SDR family NAD(P)-dependent oxidoreductase [Acetobacter senegalensis]|uniref:SDR family NAD(P)-dependent oxidoreductase n=1 Tax=Acetobacter senegalensis TaxID=446692 RepID=UPI00128CFDA9|nr:SDR family NAD(P)-dependent oxidoreductase [Acetobacter senegalensis]MCG4256286.1 SDR family NAD(P)-dependent oxidoreductase [Acetobacter senegalensis]MCG4266156.1 SDR family NAD(P)-dependent oxidoreductase [Acetobacter senegalensis]MDN7352361.1 SDR family NAD(P)-dependent oxidoreductase [Acetobacter senegalensis]MPQ72733.1 SDR family NAD(P)-dependent oxidoreductase [Acetobacter senegalensis]
MTHPLKTALVTGATAGFGHAIALRLVKEGFRVIATGRRQERLDALAKEAGENLLPFKLDVTDLAAVKALPGSLPEGWQQVDVLVNNAGLALGLEKAWETKPSDWEQMIATNVTGLVEITRALLPGMVDRNAGHVISLGSTAGTYPYPGSNVYGATKAFVDLFMRNLRSDLLGKQVRATNIAPGLCGGSEFSQVRLGDNQKAAAVYEHTKPLLPEDIAETVAWVLKLPPHVNINMVEMMPICQAAAGLAVDRTMGN